MNHLSELCSSVPAVDTAAAAATLTRLDQKTKPQGSLGRLEELACRVASIYGTATPPTLHKAIVVLGADHGIARAGVSAYPQCVTRQMLQNFARGGAAINVLARQADAAVLVVDMGTCDDGPGPCDEATIVAARLGPGTRNFAEEPAMDEVVARRAIDIGMRLVGRLADQGINLVGLGEMGIGNSTAASALTAVFTGAAVADVTGRGTGIDTAQHARKIALIEQALARHRPRPNDPVDALAKVGGFEIAGLTGVALGAALRRMPVVVDGFISTVAALAAVKLCPQVAGYLILAHQSREPGHRMLIQAIGTRPLLDLNLALGEGTGAALAMPLLDAALAILRDMACFNEAGVATAHGAPETR